MPHLLNISGYSKVSNIKISYVCPSSCCSTTSSSRGKQPPPLSASTEASSLPNGTSGRPSAPNTAESQATIDAADPPASSSKLGCCLPPARTVASALLELKLRKSREEMAAEVEAAKILDRQEGIKKQKNDPYSYRYGRRPILCLLVVCTL